MDKVYLFLPPPPDCGGWAPGLIDTLEFQIQGDVQPGEYEVTFDAGMVGVCPDDTTKDFADELETTITVQ